MTNKHTRALAALLAFGALSAISCAKGTGGGSPPPAPVEMGGVTAAAPASAVDNVATAPVASAPLAPATAPQIEAPAAPPPGDVLQAVNATQAKLEALTAGLEGTRVRFVDCAVGAACTARVEAQTLAGLRDLLAAVSAQQGGVGFVAREQLDGYAGRTFAADVTLGGGDARAVPANADDLLAN